MVHEMQPIRLRSPLTYPAYGDERHVLGTTLKRSNGCFVSGKRRQHLVGLVFGFLTGRAAVREHVFS